MVAIDVNSGNFRNADSDAEKNAYQVNMAAAGEIARQIRLRDLGGVIVNFVLGFLIFGLVLAVGGFVVNGLVGVFAGSLGQRLLSSPRAAVWLGRVMATLFLGLAARLILLQRS